MISSVNALLEEASTECTLFPVLMAWTITKQCLASPQDYGDLKVQLTEKSLEAADVVRILWIAMQNSA